MENENIHPDDNQRREGQEKLSNDSILEVMVTIFLIVVVILIFMKFEFF